MERGEQLIILSDAMSKSHLKGTKRQYSGQMSQIFKTVKSIEIHSVRPTEVCGKV